MKEIVSPFQMAGLLLTFTLGSTVMFIPSPMIAAAGNSSWLSVLAAGAVGIVLVGCVLLLHRRYPGQNLIDYYRVYYTRFGAGLLGIWLIAVLIGMIANIIVGMSYFLISSMMAETPLYSFHLLILAAAACTAYSGIEVASRMFVLCLSVPFVMLLIIILANIPLFHFEFLLPQFTDGVLPVLHGTYIALGFPYAEIFVFAILIKYVKPKQDEPLGRFMLYAVLINIATLIVINVCSTALFGEMAERRKYLLYEMARMIELAGIFERMEAIAGIVLIMGSYIKATIALIALNDISTELLGIGKKRLLVMPLATLIYFVSLTLYKTEAAAIGFWNNVWPLVVLSCAVPFMLTSVLELVMGKRKRYSLKK